MGLRERDIFAVDVGDVDVRVVGRLGNSQGGYGHEETTPAMLSVPNCPVSRPPIASP